MRFKRNILTLAIGFAATLAVVAMAALIPILLFRAQDEALFSKPRAYPHNTGTLSYNMQDVPVVEALKELQAASYTRDYNVEVLADGEPEVSGELLYRMEGHLLALADSGVLVPEMVDYLLSGPLGMPEMLRFHHTMDNRGFETITCYFVTEYSDAYYFSFDLYTDRVVAATFNLPGDAPFYTEGIEEMLNAFIVYLELDIVYDWEGRPAQVIPDRIDDLGIINTYQTVSRSSALLNLEAEYYWSIFYDNTVTLKFSAVSTYYRDHSIKELLPGASLEADPSA